MMPAEQNIAKENRFQFGKNWTKFLRVLNDERIAEAEKSLQEMLKVNDLRGKTFLDVGSGSGLFSLAAARLGASRIHSFDYDSQSVACTQRLKDMYYRDSVHWSVEQGSALDADYLSKLGQWDIVYSWGVLHHTGDMKRALETMIPLVKDDGALFIAIYNKQRIATNLWTGIKRTYVRGGTLVRGIILTVCIGYFILRGLFADLLRWRNPLKRYTEQYTPRGMSVFYDWIDWVGGYPFETAKPEEIFCFYRKRGFTLEKLVTCYGTSGINEYVFRKMPAAAKQRV